MNNTKEIAEQLWKLAFELTREAAPSDELQAARVNTLVRAARALESSEERIESQTRMLEQYYGKPAGQMW